MSFVLSLEKGFDDTDVGGLLSVVGEWWRVQSRMYSQLQLRAGSPDGRGSCCSFQEGRALWGQCRIVWSGTWRFF